MRKGFAAPWMFAVVSYAIAQSTTASAPTRPDNDYGGLVPKPIRAPGPRSEPKYCEGRKNLGHEGASLFKANGKYYLGAADTYQGRYSSICAVSDNIFGPFSKIHEAVPCGGGTNYFKDKEGDWFDCVFGNDDSSSWREKPGIVKIAFAADDTIEVAKKQPGFVLVNPRP